MCDSVYDVGLEDDAADDVSSAVSVAALRCSGRANRGVSGLRL
jgi:hypothetical protein